MSNPPADDTDLARTLGRLAVDMRNHQDADSVLRAIVQGAVAIVPGARWAGISLITGRTIEARVPSDPLVAELDALQSRLDDGPCITAIRTHHTVRIDDMAAQTRYPRFGAAAQRLGVHSSLSFQLFVRKDDFGALNLYGGEPHVFDEDSVLYGEILAQHAAIAIAGSQAEDQMTKALLSRDIIGQAKGIIMERFDVDATAAFAMLTRLSQERNENCTSSPSG